MSETSSFCFPCNLDIVANLKEKYNKWNDFFNLKHPIQDKQEFSIFAQQNRNLKLLTGCDGKLCNDKIPYIAQYLILLKHRIVSTALSAKGADEPLNASLDDEPEEEVVRICPNFIYNESAEKIRQDIRQFRPSKSASTYQVYMSRERQARPILSTFMYSPPPCAEKVDNTNKQMETEKVVKSVIKKMHNKWTQVELSSLRTPEGSEYELSDSFEGGLIQMHSLPCFRSISEKINISKNEWSCPERKKYSSRKKANSKRQHVSSQSCVVPSSRKSSPMGHYQIQFLEKWKSCPPSWAPQTQMDSLSQGRSSPSPEEIPESKLNLDDFVPWIDFSTESSFADNTGELTMTMDEPIGDNWSSISFPPPPPPTAGLFNSWKIDTIELLNKLQAINEKATQTDWQENFI